MALSPVPCTDPSRAGKTKAKEVEGQLPHSSEDLEAFKAYTKKMIPKLEKVALRFVKHQGKAHDIVADVQHHMDETGYHKFQKKMEKWEPVLGAYLTVAVKRGCYKLLKAEGRMDQWDDTQRQGDQRKLVVIEVPVDIQRCLDRLEEEERKMFLYKELDGWKIEELASEFSKSEGAVRVQLFRTRLRLKNWMRKGGYRTSSDSHMTRKEGR